MVELKRSPLGVVVVLAICWQLALSTPAPTEQQGTPPVGGTHEQVEGIRAGVGDTESEDPESADAEGADAGGVDAEGRSCGNCGIPAHPPLDLTHDFGNFVLPDIFGKWHDKLQDVKLLTLIGLAIPILVLQIITLSIVAYLLKMVKSEDDTGTGSGTGGYYAAFPVQPAGGYKDSYSSYRSLMPSEDTMTWVLERLSDAVDLYHDYQDHKNVI